MAPIARPRQPPRQRPRLSVDDIVDAALWILDEEGLDGLRTTNVAKRLGVSQPALYSHLASLDELRAAVSARGAAELSDRVRSAVGDRVGDDAVRAMARAYRDYVRQHPDRYLLQLSAPRTPAYTEATERAAEAVRSVLRSYGLDDEQVRQSHLAFRAAVHGFVHLEARDALGSGTDAPDAHFDFFIDLYAAGLRSLAGPDPA
jgi:AcrR family transcriptional regulator